MVMLVTLGKSGVRWVSSHAAKDIYPILSGLQEQNPRIFLLLLGHMLLGPKHDG
jgi:hypothetical protein